MSLLSGYSSFGVLGRGSALHCLRRRLGPVSGGSAVRHFGFGRPNCFVGGSNASADEQSGTAAEKGPEGSGVAALQPKELVAELDRHIIGQDEAKKAVAIALRNRWRRQRVGADIKDEVHPKNILMIGSTGVGKTEFARRLAKLSNAPFVKVEATKFTSVGYYGRDVDEIITDLVHVAIQAAKERHQSRAKAQWLAKAEYTIAKRLARFKPDMVHEEILEKIQKGEFDAEPVEIDSGSKNPSSSPNAFEFSSMATIFPRVDPGSFQSGSKSGGKRMTVKEAREQLIKEMSNAAPVEPKVIQDAIKDVEENGIVVIDEIDKICIKAENRHGPDVSSEGVQRDLLPLIEGCTVNTKHGNVKTDHILFIAAGAFHTCSPSDLLAELQGRLPIRVQLKSLTQKDLHRILTEPESSLIKQQIALMETENVKLVFTDDATNETARIATEINTQIQNIGARRLHTVVERIMEDISFEAPEKPGESVVVDGDYVRGRLQPLLHKHDLSKFIL